MTNLLYVTGNSVKFTQGRATCESFGIELEQAEVDIHEIQAATGDIVALDKAQKSFAEIQQPLVVSDDSWMIPGLNNFPGPYMKYVNEWFTPEDWLRLTKDLTDRTIVLRQIVVYIDKDIQKTFSVDIPGILLSEIRGTSKYPHSTITSFDNGLHSNAEYHEKNESAAQHHHNPWHEFAEWYAKENS